MKEWLSLYSTNVTIRLVGICCCWSSHYCLYVRVESRINTSVGKGGIVALLSGPFVSIHYIGSPSARSLGSWLNSLSMVGVQQSLSIWWCSRNGIWKACIAHC